MWLHAAWIHPYRPGARSLRSDAKAAVGVQAEPGMPGNSLFLGGYKNDSMRQKLGGNDYIVVFHAEQMNGEVCSMYGVVDNYVDRSCVV